MFLAEQLCQIRQWSFAGIEQCRKRLSDPDREWNPAPWINGSDLIQAGLKPSPAFGKLLSQARSMQLDGQLESQSMAMEWLKDQIGRIVGGQ